MIKNLLSPKYKNIVWPPIFMKGVPTSIGGISKTSLIDLYIPQS
jgi:hypothetical protein